MLSDAPAITLLNTVTAVEFDLSVRLRCTAESKPAATFYWYKEGTANVLVTGNGTTGFNGLDFIIQNPTRDDAGIYRCEADNGISDKDSKTVELVIRCECEVHVWLRK